MPKQVKLLIDDPIIFNIACKQRYNVKFRTIEERSKNNKSFVTVTYLDFSQAKDIKSLTLVVELKDEITNPLPNEEKNLIRLPQEEKKNMSGLSQWCKNIVQRIRRGA